MYINIENLRKTCGRHICVTNFIKLIEIVILWVYYTIPFGFSLFWHFWDIIFQPFQLLSLAKDQ